MEKDLVFENKTAREGYLQYPVSSNLVVRKVFDSTTVLDYDNGCYRLWLHLSGVLSNVSFLKLV